MSKQETTKLLTRHIGKARTDTANLTENTYDIQPTDKTSNQSHEQAQVILPSKGTIS